MEIFVRAKTINSSLKNKLNSNELNELSVIRKFRITAFSKEQENLTASKKIEVFELQLAENRKKMNLYLKELEFD
ncbi:MAG: hypothetical protein V4591_09520 [Bdellovibrionota bacterium]